MILVLTDEERKAKRKEYYSRPEVKAKRKEYYSRPESRAKQKEHREKPEVKAKHKERVSRPENKAKAKAKREKPEIKAKVLAKLKKRYATDAKYRDNMLDYSKKYQKKRLEPDGVSGQAKAKVFAHYSKVLSNSDIPICACCGYSDLRFLSVDHIDGRKNMSEKEKKHGSRRLWIHLIKTGLPSGYQILCHNCNIAKGQEKYCPHQLDKM